jgi:hypothetical protein
MAGPPTAHNIQLTATRNGNRVRVTGPGGANLPQGSGVHRFNFALTDNTGLNVQFASLDTEDNCSTCPPATGKNSQQIVGETIKNDQTASFTDNNNNSGTMDVCYQWNFTCNNPNVTVEPYDPIIINGGV